MTIKLILSLVFLVTASAWAQSVYIPERGENPTQIKATTSITKSKKIAIQSGEFLPELLAQRLKSVDDQAAVSCGDKKSYNYLLKLTKMGHFNDCVVYAETCFASNKQIDIPTMIQGARCAGALNLFERTNDLFENARQLDDFKDGNISILILEHAIFANYGIYAHRTDSIINSHSFWTTEQKKMARGLVDFLGKNDLKEVTKEEVLSFIDGELSTDKKIYSEWLRVKRIKLAGDEYQIPKAFDLLIRDARQILNPIDLWEVGFNVLYRMADGGKFPLPKRFFDSFLPHANPHSFFPVEQNVFNYSELESSTCQSSMMTSNERKSFTSQKKKWRQGDITFREFRDFVQSKLGNKTKSDILSTYASLLAIEGKLDSAREYYWLSHQACPYNNRSHWGLSLLNRQEKFMSYPEFQVIETKIEQEVQATTFPVEIENYVVNWKAFPVHSQTRIKHGLRIWAPFIKALLNSNKDVYVKLPFELLSDSPSMGNLRNTRIGPPDMPSYKHDNRLWDDVRGAGGSTVIADHDEVTQSPHGAYNLMVHEVAHQFHGFLKGQRRELGVCLDKLYQNAKARNQFPDGYAASNVEEYFAQGVTYFMIPVDSPARYGLNSSWLPVNDLDLFNFIISINSSDGKVEKIECPI